MCSTTVSKHSYIRSYIESFCRCEDVVQNSSVSSVEKIKRTHLTHIRRYNRAAKVPSRQVRLTTCLETCFRIQCLAFSLADVVLLDEWIEELISEEFHVRL